MRRLSWRSAPKPQRSPKLIVPKQRLDTLSPLLPNSLYRIARTLTGSRREEPRRRQRHRERRRAARSADHSRRHRERPSCAGLEELGTDTQAEQRAAGEPKRVRPVVGADEEPEHDRVHGPLDHVVARGPAPPRAVAMSPPC